MYKSYKPESIIQYQYNTRSELITIEINTSKRISYIFKSRNIPVNNTIIPRRSHKVRPEVLGSKYFEANRL